MRGIPIFSPNATDFSGNGLGLLLPIECTVEEEAGGLYELTLIQPIMGDGRWAQIENGCLIKAAVPVRESPVYEMSAFDSGSQSTSQSVIRQIYRVRTNTGARLRLRQKPNTSSKILGRYKPGTQVVKLSDAGNSWFKVSILKGGATGYMHSGYLTFVKNETQTVTQTKPVDRKVVTVEPARDQLFRIYSVERDTSRKRVTAKARHVFFDLTGNLLNAKYSPKKQSAATVANYVFSHLLNETDFLLHVGDVQGKITAEYGYKNPVEILCDPDEGILSQSGSILIRDNFDGFVLPDLVRDMGVTVRRRKNLKSVITTHDASGIVTRIIPVGKKKNGDDLFLTGNKYVDSPNMSAYPVIYAQRIEYDVKVGDGDGEFATESAARAELKRLAEADFNKGVDLPNYSMDIDFIMLNNTPEYPDYASLNAVHLYDTVSVIDELIGLKAKVRVTGYEWDVLSRRYTHISLGDLQSVERTVYGYNIANGSVSGTKLIEGSVGGNVLRDLSVGYAKIDVAAISQLNAQALAAVKADIHQIIAGEITTDQLYADLAKLALAQITTANIKNANIDWAEIASLTAKIAEIAEAKIGSATITVAQIQNLNAAVAEIAEAKIAGATISTAQIDNLAAVIAQAVHLEAQTGNFSLAEVKNLLSGALILEEGMADSMMIKNLAVTSANMLNATVDKLVLKGSDGKYYRVHVDSDGDITTEEVTVTAGEIAAGETADGRQIAATTANVGSLNASTVKASQAVLGTIFAQSLTAGKITAGEALMASATIPALYVTAIQAIGDSLDLSANQSITLKVGEAVNNLQIGGTNLIQESGAFTALRRWKPNWGTVCEVAECDGYPCLHAVGSVAQTSSVYPLEWDTEYTLHCMGKFATGGTKPTYGTPMHYWIYKGNVLNGIGATNGAHTSVSLALNGTVTAPGTTELPANEWVHIECKFKTIEKPDDCQYVTFRPFFYGSAAGEGCEYWIRWIKLEKGNKATDWSPAPEDTAEEIEGLGQRMTTAESTILQKADSIALTVVEQKADAAQSAVNNLQIGGTNLIIGSSRYRKGSELLLTSASKDGLVVDQHMHMPCVPGETYVFQCKTDGVWGTHDSSGAGGGRTHLFLYLQTANETGNAYKNAAVLSDPKYIGKSGLGIWSYTVPDDEDYVRIKFRFDIHSDGTTPYTVKWWDVKAEKGNKATDWSPPPEDTESEIKGIQVGGTNLLRDTKAFGGNGAANYVLGGTLQTDAYDGFAARYASNNTDSAITLMRFSDSRWQRGKDYMLSFWAKGSGFVHLVMTSYGFPCSSVASSGQTGMDAGGSVNIPVTSDWRRYWIRFTMGDWSAETASKQLYLEVAAHSTVYVCGLKLENGSRATDWSPAPEDVQEDISAVGNSAETALGMAERVGDEAEIARQLAEAAQSAADAAAGEIVSVQTQLTQTANGLSVVRTQTIPDLAGRVETIESGVHIEGSQIGIYTSDSPFRNTITHDGWVISENGNPIISCHETRLDAPRVQVTDAFLIGDLAWKPSADKHLRLLKYRS